MSNSLSKRENEAGIVLTKEINKILHTVLSAIQIGQTAKQVNLPGLIQKIHI